MTKKKPEESSGLLREPKAKKKLGLAVPRLIMPHDELFPPKVIPFESSKSDDIISENPSDNFTGHPEQILPDTQPLEIGTPSIQETGHSGISNTGHSAGSQLDTQTSKNIAPSNSNTGHSERSLLDTLAPSQDFFAPSKPKKLDTKTPSKKTAGHSKNENWRQWEGKRSTVRVNLHIDRELDKKVRSYCLDAEPRMDLKGFYEQAALLLLDTQSSTKLGANAPLDDLKLKIWKTKPRIINLYCRLTGNSKWKMNDDAKASAYNEIDLRIIELGILQTLGNRQGSGKINSFSYFTNEINTWIESNPAEATMDELLKHYRRRLGVATPEGEEK